MRHALRWAVRQPRVWVAAVAFVLVTLFVLAGERGGIANIAIWAYVVIALVVRQRWMADHPEAAEHRARRRAAKYQAQVDEIVRRYEARQRGEPDPPRLPWRERRAQRRRERREQRERAEVESLLWRYERERLARERERTSR